MTASGFLRFLDPVKNDKLVIKGNTIAVSKNDQLVNYYNCESPCP